MLARFGSRCGASWTSLTRIRSTRSCAAWRRHGPACVVLDLRELRFLDSCGLARLLAARRRARKLGHRLLLVRGPKAIQRLFALSAVDEAFEMVSEVPAAMAGTTPRA